MTIRFNEFIETYNKKMGTDCQSEKEMMEHAFNHFKFFYELVEFFNVADEPLRKCLRNHGFMYCAPISLAQKLKKYKKEHFKDMTISEISLKLGYTRSFVLETMKKMNYQYKNIRNQHKEKLITSLKRQDRRLLSNMTPKEIAGKLGYSYDHTYAILRELNLPYAGKRRKKR